MLTNRFTYALVVGCLLSSASICDAASAYTDAAAFNAAVAEQGLNFVVGFDAQVSGSDADAYGMLNIGAEGLRSDGSTRAAIAPIATNLYSTVSASNSMGASGSEDQFLAGNGDRIQFQLSNPVNAFAVRLIGNPSPTSEDAMPFWRMHADIGSGFDAYSATEPSQTLSRGNDVYFLGIISEDEFNRVDLFSDNDLAAVFSFNVDDVAVAADVKTLELADVKFSDPQAVVVSGIVVTRVHSDRFNVETQDRTAGLAVLGDGATRGNEVSFFGEVQTTDDGEHVMNLIHLIDSYQPNTGIPAPLGIGDLGLGGGADLGLQTGCIGSVGPNNIGLDVVVWGKITAIAPDNSWITVDDGSGRESGMGHPGVKVVGPVVGRYTRVGQSVRVTGSSSIFRSGTDYYPMVRVANSYDVTIN